jgi:hypothetical protein
MVMALGLSYGSGGGADFLPIVKYDARAGRIFRVDREDGVSTPTDITKNFKAVFDFENVQVGWMRFVAGAAPDFVLVDHGQQMPSKPSDEHRQGVRIVMLLSDKCGGDIREMTGNAAAFLRGMDKLHNDYEEQSVNNKGKLPVVVLEDTVSVETGSGVKKSTNYSPVFKIIGWSARPASLVKNSRSSEESPSRSGPPSTGSTKVDAPAKSKAPVTVSDDDDDDFGN